MTKVMVWNPDLGIFEQVDQESANVLLDLIEELNQDCIENANIEIDSESNGE